VKNNALFAVLPTIEQLLNDPFMKQVHYGSVLTEELMRLDMPTDNADHDFNDDDTANVRRLLGESIKAQLSHSQGIRGFMVSYLTADSTPADNPRIPAIILDALLDQVKTDPHDLVPLTCTYGKLRSCYFNSIVRLILSTGVPPDNNRYERRHAGCHDDDAYRSRIGC
jgi:hypothetical protein